MVEHNADLNLIEIRAERAQAQLVVVSDKTWTGLQQTDHAAVFEPSADEMHLQTKEELCDQVRRDVQLAAFSCSCSPSIANEVEARPGGLDLDIYQRVFSHSLL